MQLIQAVTVHTNIYDHLYHVYNYIHAYIYASGGRTVVLTYTAPLETTPNPRGALTSKFSFHIYKLIHKILYHSYPG